VEGAQRREAAARAVLASATAAAREGRLLSAEERAAAERPVLFPEQYAAEQEQLRATQEQVHLISCMLAPAIDLGAVGIQ
jgi:hypothetical protein